jgi:hypothetical protein
MEPIFKFNIEAERVGSHVLLHWDNPIVGFGSFDICTETGTVFCDEVGKELTYKIINDWLRPVNQYSALKICHEVVQYDYVLKDGTIGIVVSYVFKDEVTNDFERNQIVIVSKCDETTIYHGLFKQTFENIYVARRYVKEYLASCGVTVLQR